jgi:hypothetical protein
MCITSFP